MHARKVNEMLNESEYCSVEQICQLANLGATTVRKLAGDAGAVRKIGRSYRIKRSIFFDYVEKMYSE